MTRPDRQFPALPLALGAGVLLFLAGAGWAVQGEDVFLATVMAGLAGCF